MLALVSDLPLVPVVAEIAEMFEFYIAQKVMPRDPVGDAWRLALASFHMRFFFDLEL